MAWYECSCGFLTRQTPRPGESFVSVYHRHSSRLPAGSVSLVPMMEIPDVTPDRARQINEQIKNWQCALSRLELVQPGEEHVERVHVEARDSSETTIHFSRRVLLRKAL